VFYNTGHGHLGWTLSAVTADMVGDVVADAMRTQAPLQMAAPAAKTVPA